jgi:hypothetical protein
LADSVAEYNSVIAERVIVIQPGVIQLAWNLSVRESKHRKEI